MKRLMRKSLLSAPGDEVSVKVTGTGSNMVGRIKTGKVHATVVRRIRKDGTLGRKICYIMDN